ncbi:MAG: rhomboid family intramembrane serine protease [Gemmatimonadota bacterium]|nr:rhomboid family intramembrane serine protease [Gemmatimonadota bacterium]MDH5759660.1 rhomboid family intramembrane serine protease [Gemmatimonadota bacterium]
MIALTPWVIRLIVANLIVFVLTGGSPSLHLKLALWPPGVLQHPWTPITYMFVHAGFSHIFLNMLMLFMFGPRLEERLGGRDFIRLYLLAGLGGALLTFVFQPAYPVVGASGAVYGVTAGFAMLWPRERVYIWGVLPVEIWLLTTVMVFLSLYFGMSGGQPGIAHFAHLGGLVTGIGYLKGRDWWRGAARREFRRAATGHVDTRSPDDTTLQRWRAIPLARLHELNREEAERLLLKAERQGVRSLTLAERAFMDRLSSNH